MIAKRMLISALDRPGGRWLLSALASWYARRKTDRDVSVWYDGLWVRSLDSKIHFTDMPEFRYFADDIADFPRIAEGMSEAVKDYWFYLYKPGPGDLIVDVGAGFGFDSFVFSRSVGSSGRVIAIEAHPKTFRRLEKFCRLNQLTNVTPLHLAAVDKKRDVYIESLINDELNSVELEPKGEAAFKVQGLSIDEICRQQKVERIDLLKMNIEGAERLAIQGMAEMIKKTRYACIACHDFRAGESDKFSTTAAVSDFLRDNHFQVTVRSEDPRPHVRAHLHAVNTVISSQ